jgi:alpha-D-ribose 1-methylphosphonate 5-triphosphate diphosphatase PhnM
MNRRVSLIDRQAIQAQMNHHENFLDLYQQKRTFQQDKRKMHLMKLEQEEKEKKKLNEFTIRIRR